MVEDDPATRKALRSILRLRKWDVHAVSTLAEARPILESGVDCLILDLMLPDGDGVTLLRAVRDADLNTRVIVTTGTNDSYRLASVRALRPDRLFFKPIELAKLLEALAGDP